MPLAEVGPEPDTIITTGAFFVFLGKVSIPVKLYSPTFTFSSVKSFVFFKFILSEIYVF